MYQRKDICVLWKVFNKVSVLYDDYVIKCSVFARYVRSLSLSLYVSLNYEMVRFLSQCSIARSVHTASKGSQKMMAKTLI